MNILRERYQFHHRQQKTNESIDEFASEIRRLASSCEFDSLTESLIRDHVLFGLRNQKKSREIIECGGDPSLSDIIDICSGRSVRKAKPQKFADENVFEGNYKVNGMKKLLF